jgi:protein gp37
MAETTGITWADSTWNPWRGCLKVSEGCAHCYADTQSKRNPAVLGTWGPEGVGTRVLAAESYWLQPHNWNARAERERRPWRVFCCSLADVFEEWAGPMVGTGERRAWRARTDERLRPWYPATGESLFPAGEFTPYTLDDARARAFRVMEQTPHLTWLVLTKRPANILRMVPRAWLLKWPANVWPGATTENQARADERIPDLLKVPAAVRWLSAEPQLGRVDLRRWLVEGWCAACRSTCFVFNSECRGCSGPARPLIQWVITGGESGAGARPFQVEWARALRDQCRAAGVAFFHKQHGDNAHDGGELIQLGRGGKVPSEWAADVRVQEFPVTSPLYG